MVGKPYITANAQHVNFPPNFPARGAPVEGHGVSEFLTGRVYKAVRYLL